MEFTKVGAAKYIGSWKKFKEENEAGTLIVQGEYLGTVQGTYGDLYQFEQDGQKVVLNYAGHLKYLINEYLEEGDVCQIFYAGTEILQRGAFAGKETHKFELALAKKQETSLELEKDRQKEEVLDEEAEESDDFDEFAGI